MLALLAGNGCKIMFYNVIMIQNSAQNNVKNNLNSKEDDGIRQIMILAPLVFQIFHQFNKFGIKLIVIFEVNYLRKNKKVSSTLAHWLGNNDF